MKKHFCRLGDGYPIEMSESEIMADLVEGSEDAADRVCCFYCGAPWR